MAKHRWLRRALGLGLLAGAAYAAWRAIEANRAEHGSTWEPQPFPFLPQPHTAARSTVHEVGTEVLEAATAAARTPADTAWVEPTQGECPLTHPVKAKLSSGIFHVPGGRSYDRTVPDRCYADGTAAEAEGFRAAKH